MFCDLTGRKALVTGASRGIGRAIALELAAAGADIIVHYARQKDQADEVCAQIREMGRGCSLVQADLSVREELERLCNEIGSIDILVSNASMQIKKKFEEITYDEFEQQMHCNLYASMRLMQDVIPEMKKKSFGRIVTIGSVQECKPHPEMGVYAASKSAQSNLVESLAAQLGEYGITFNNIAPGVIVTDRNKEGLADDRYVEKLKTLIPTRTFGQPEDCAGIVRLLCADEGKYITGQTIYVDGGKHL